MNVDIIDKVNIKDVEDIPLLSLYKIQRYIEMETDKEKLSRVSHVLNLILKQTEDKIL
jgi:hypothetical protein